jgi:hypothetical protein
VLFPFGYLLREDLDHPLAPDLPEPVPKPNQLLGVHYREYLRKGFLPILTVGYLVLRHFAAFFKNSLYRLARCEHLSRQLKDKNQIGEVCLVKTDGTRFFLFLPIAHAVLQIHTATTSANISITICSPLFISFSNPSQSFTILYRKTRLLILLYQLLFP